MRTNLKRCEKRSKDTPTKPSTILKPRVKHLTFFLGVGIAFDVHSWHSWQLNNWILKLHLEPRVKVKGTMGPGVLPLHSPNSKHQQIPGIGGFGGVQETPRYPRCTQIHPETSVPLGFNITADLTWPSQVVVDSVISTARELPIRILGGEDWWNYKYYRTSFWKFLKNPKVVQNYCCCENCEEWRGRVILMCECSCFVGVKQPCRINFSGWY